MSLHDARTTGQLTEQFEEMRKRLRDMADEVDRFSTSTQHMGNYETTCNAEIPAGITSLKDALYEAERQALLTAGRFGEIPAARRWQQ